MSLKSTASESAVRVAVDVRRLPWVRRLAADYAYDFPAVAPFFAGNPAEPAAWAAAIRRTQAHERRRREIATIIAAQQQRRGAPSAAQRAAGSLADPKTVAVVTGQQAGLFGGPLFTLFKALTALKLAREVSHRHEVPVVAVFWIDAEDHDWNEVRTCTVLDEAMAPRRVALPPRASAAPVPVASVRLDDSVAAAIDELEAALPATEFRAGLISGLRDAYAPGVGMVEAFARWLEQVLGSRGLVVYDASDPASKPLASQVFARELTTGETARRAAAAGVALQARGYHSQVTAQDEALALFRLDAAGRRAIRRQDGLFVVGDDRVPQADLVGEAAERPSGFSPNVLLRPVVQDTIFPTIAYIAGPSELAYLGQLRGVYDHFGVPMPLMYPRATATLVDAGAARFIAKYDVSLEALQPQDEAALNELLLTQIPPEVEASFAAAADAVAAGMARVTGAVPAIDPTLEGAARSTLGRMRHDLDTLRNKMLQAAKRRDETLRRQFSRTRALAFPNGHAQEREIGFVSFLNQYGPALVERLEAELPLELGRHWIVTI